MFELVFDVCLVSYCLFFSSLLMVDGYCFLERFIGMQNGQLCQWLWEQNNSNLVACRTMTIRNLVRIIGIWIDRRRVKMAITYTMRRTSPKTKSAMCVD
jgi:hypothetical protein